MAHAIAGGIFYFLLVFGAGFLLGTVRIPLLAPRVGETAAVLIELPAMLAISWVACGFVLRRLRVPAAPAARLAMGAVAFALLIAAEATLAAAFGGTPASFLLSLQSAPGALGLAGQFAFAVFPLARRARI